MTRATRVLLACAIVGPLLFIVVFLIEGATRPGYSAWRNYVSELALSGEGWQQIANFLICGTLCVVLAVGVRRVWPTGKSSVAGPVLMGLFGLGLVVAGLFVTDPARNYPPGAPMTGSPQTWHGMIHGINRLVVFVILLPAACFAFARRFARDPRSRGWATYSWIVGAILLLLFPIGTASGVLAEHGILASPTGLIQRFEIILGWTWIAGSALRLMRRA
ncbi:MAG TPA: DUF998 domain-containing protein [Candidatus Dormibacteraeota bacterium]